MIAANYKPRIKTAADRALFFAVVTFGILLALILKVSSSTDFWKIWAPLIVTVGLQIVYAFCVMQLPLFRLREDRAGDSFYYLGLLYTLASLAYTLVEFGVGSQQETTDTANVIGGFGVALGTTIVGLILRVFVQQFRSDPTEIEHEARNTLVEVAEKLSGEIHSVINDVTALRQSVKQVVEEGMKESASAATSAMTAATDKFSKEVDTLISGIDTTFKSFVGSAQQLSKVSQGTVAALSKLSDRIEKIEPPSNVVELVFGPARDGMKKAADALTEAADGQKSQIQRLGELVTMSVQALQGLQGTLQAIGTGAADVATTISALKSVSTEAANVTTQLGQISSLLSETVQRQRASSTDTENILAQAARKMQEATEGITRSHASAIQSIDQSTRALGDIASKHAQGIEEQLEKARSASGRLVDEVVNMAESIAVKLAE